MDIDINSITKSLNAKNDHPKNIYTRIKITCNVEINR